MAITAATDGIQKPACSPATYAIIIERVGTATRGDRWRVTHAGVVVIDSTLHPEHDAARYFDALGISGVIETYHAGSSALSMRLDIERAAKRTVTEGVRAGPRLSQWQKFDAQRRAGIAIAESAAGDTAANEATSLPM